MASKTLDKLEDLWDEADEAGIDMAGTIHLDFKKIGTWGGKVEADEENSEETENCTKEEAAKCRAKLRNKFESFGNLSGWSTAGNEKAMRATGIHGNSGDVSPGDAKRYAETMGKRTTAYYRWLRDQWIHECD